MTLSASFHATVDALLAARVPFAVCALPGRDPSLALPGSGLRFVLCPWASPASAAVDVLSPQASGSVAPPVWARSTPPGEYFHAVRAAIAAHTPASGKTVLSRVICGTARLSSWGSAAADLFAAFPAAFRYICWSPATGGWMGATPELLARVDTAASTISTVALAGTRLAAETGPWDEKNRREHAMVAEFLADTLAARCDDVRVGPVAPVQYGEIAHLCCPVTAALRTGTDPADIIDLINPTPAVAGFPRDEAVARIAALEGHPRRFYAGFVELADSAFPPVRSLYVNLRCAAFDPASRLACVYAGGGITALSDPDTEWTETARKAAPLISVLRLQ